MPNSDPRDRFVCPTCVNTLLIDSYILVLLDNCFHLENWIHTKSNIPSLTSMFNYVCSKRHNSWLSLTYWLFPGYQFFVFVVASTYVIISFRIICLVVCMNTNLECKNTKIDQIITEKDYYGVKVISLHSNLYSKAEKQCCVRGMFEKNC